MDRQAGRTEGREPALHPPDVAYTEDGQRKAAEVDARL
jgi:hypothetical protein